jgi:hypothetical protein
VTEGKKVGTDADEKKVLPAWLLLLLKVKVVYSCVSETVFRRGFLPGGTVTRFCEIVAQNVARPSIRFLKINTTFL